MDVTKDLQDMCGVITKEISNANDKIKSANGKLTGDDVAYIDKLTHSLKSIKAVMAMMEGEDGYSQGDGSYAPDGNSYARGRRGGYSRYAMMPELSGSYLPYGRYPRRYSYAGNDELMEKLRELMDEVPETMRGDVRRLIEKAERA